MLSSRCNYMTLSLQEDEVDRLIEDDQDDLEAAELEVEEAMAVLDPQAGGELECFDASFVMMSLDVMLVIFFKSRETRKKQARHERRHFI